MPRNASGTYSLPAGNPVVTGTTISSTVNNNTFSDIATEITDSLSRSGEGAMLAALEVVDGVIGTPGLSWDTEPTSGFYRSGSGDFRFVIGGSDIFTITASGLAVAGALSAGGNSVGYLGIPQNNQNGNYTLVAADAGKHVYKSSGGAGETITIPANASVAYAIGTTITIVNQGGGTLTVAITTDTLYQAGNGSTGSRTLASFAVATIIKVTSTAWIISGTGVS